MVNHVKVLHQYLKVLSDSASGQGPHAPLLLGFPESCVNGLEWFAPLCGPMQPQPAKEEYESHVDLWRQSNPGLYSYAEAAYNVHQSYEVEDPHMTRFLVSLMKPAAKEYEVAIAGNILRARPASFDEFSGDFLGWRKRGLYHTLCLAARAMPSLDQWVPPRLEHEAEDWEELLGEFNKRSSCSAARMAGLFERLADRSFALNNHVCGLLDRVAILTRVKSNYPGEANLDEFAESLKFPITEPFVNSLEFCVELKPVLEGAVPPSLMCPSLDPPSRGTWGYRKLELQLTESENVVIHTGTLTWIDKEHIDVSCKQDGLHPERLRDILFRIGEALTSPEIAQLMYLPGTVEKIVTGLGNSADSNEEIRAICCNRPALITMMDKFNHLPPWTRCAQAIEAVIQAIPSPTEYTHAPPMRLLAWRVDCPSKVILYEGAHDQLDLSQNFPHHLPKDVYPDRNYFRTTSGISLIPHGANVDVHDALRSCIANEIAGKHSDFSNHASHQVLIKHAVGRPPSSYTSTTLAEAVSVFSGPPPANTSRVTLHESVPWENEHIDFRYAEHQSADNGSRFRDWLTVYRKDDELHRCRLAAHEAVLETTYSSCFPVEKPASAALQPGVGSFFDWISVHSSLPAEIRTLRYLGGQTITEALKRSVDNRFMNDSKLLPVRNVGDKVERVNMEIYSDEESRQVVIAYAPTSAVDGAPRNIEVMSFRAM